VFGFVAVAMCVAACGGGQGPNRPATVDHLSDGLHDASDCPVEVKVARLPVPHPRLGNLAPAIERFDKQASIGALVSCEDWLSGFISYFDFPSAERMRAAVRSRAPLREHQVYCAKGSELIINELFGYDYTADLCKDLGFPIHRPQRRA
jgi:hypothetical protein